MRRRWNPQSQNSFSSGSASGSSAPYDVHAVPVHTDSSIISGREQSNDDVVDQSLIRNSASFRYSKSSVGSSKSDDSSFFQTHVHFLGSDDAKVAGHAFHKLDQAREKINLLDRMSGLQTHSIYSLLSVGRGKSNRDSLFDMHSFKADTSDSNVGDSDFGVRQDSAAAQNNVHAVQAFTRAIVDETEPIETPADIGAALQKCDCGFPCELRRFFFNNIEYHMMVCAGRKCMTWLTFREIYPDGTVVTASANTAAQNATSSSSATTTKPPPKKKAPVFNRNDPIEKQLKDFWADAWIDGIVVEDSAARVMEIFVGEAPTCDCNKPARLVASRFTSDLFWACQNESCFFAVFCRARPDACSFDLGQFTPLGYSVLDRHTTFTRIMGWFGYSFTKRFATALHSRPSDCKRKWPRGSYPIEATPEASKILSRKKHDIQFDYFVSYRGASNAFLLYSAFCAFLNFLPAFITLMVVFLLIMLTLWAIEDPCSAGVPEVFLGGCDTDDRSWFVFVPYGGLILVLVILFFNPAFSFLWGRKIFMDKYCIQQSQTSSDHTQLGIARLPLYLRSSKVFISLFDSNYFDRCWCVWELAVYLKIRSFEKTRPKVKFVSVSKAALEVFAVLFVVIEGTILFSLRSGQGAPFANFTGTWRNVFEWVVWGSNLLLFTLIFLLGQSNFRSQSKIRQQFSHFSIEASQLAIEDDREILLRFVDELFVGHDAAHTESVGRGLLEFDKFVKEKVPQYFPVSGWRSWALFSYPGAVLVSSIFFLGTLDKMGYNWTDREDQSTSYFSRSGTTVLCIAYIALVHRPFAWYVLTAEIRFFLFLQERTKLKYWHSVLVCLPIFLLWENLFGYTSMIFSNIETLVAWAILDSYLPCHQLVGAVTGCEARGELPFMLTFSAFYGISPGYGAISQFARVDIELEFQGWIRVLVIIFIMIPCIIFVSVLYEPTWAKNCRSWIWRKLQNYWARGKNEI
eukprot:gene140-458_t